MRAGCLTSGIRAALRGFPAPLDSGRILRIRVSFSHGTRFPVPRTRTDLLY